MRLSLVSTLFGCMLGFFLCSMVRSVVFSESSVPATEEVLGGSRLGQAEVTAELTDLRTQLSMMTHLLHACKDSVSETFTTLDRLAEAKADEGDRRVGALWSRLSSCADHSARWQERRASTFYDDVSPTLEVADVDDVEASWLASHRRSLLLRSLAMQEEQRTKALAARLADRDGEVVEVPAVPSAASVGPVLTVRSAVDGGCQVRMERPSVPLTADAVATARTRYAERVDEACVQPGADVPVNLVRHGDRSVYPVVDGGVVNVPLTVDEDVDLVVGTAPSGRVPVASAAFTTLLTSSHRSWKGLRDVPALLRSLAAYNARHRTAYPLIFFTTDTDDATHA